MPVMEHLRNKSAELIALLRDLAALVVVLAVAFATIAAAAYLTSATVTWESEAESVALVTEGEGTGY